MSIFNIKNCLKNILNDDNFDAIKYYRVQKYSQLMN